MDCRNTRALFPYFLLPGELAADEATEIERHLEDCVDCASWARSEQAFDAKVGQAMRNVAVPELLRENIVTRLAVERGRRWRKQAVYVTSVAAAALVVLAIGFGWWSTAKVEVSPETVARGADEKLISIQNTDADFMTAYFRGHGIRFQMPPEFDPRYVSHYEVTRYEGHLVAQIDYLRDNAQAHVYLLPKRHFKLAKGSAGITPASLCSVEVLDLPGDFLFVVVYVGDARREQFGKIEIVG